METTVFALDKAMCKLYTLDVQLQLQVCSPHQNLFKYHMVDHDFFHAVHHVGHY